MRFPELFQQGTMLFISWKVFHEDERKLPLREQTFCKRPVWSPVLTCDCDFEQTHKAKWNKILITLYDVTQVRYIKWTYKHCLDKIEDGTIQVVD